MRNEEIHIRRFYIMSSIKLTDLISVQVLQEIQDGFAEVTGMAALTTDADGNPVTKGSNFTDFCMKYTRRSRVGCERCEKCDRDGGKQTHRTGRAAAYSCHGGLMDFAAPIMVDGEFIGSFIGGQVLTEKPDEAKFRKIAKELGIAPSTVSRALKKPDLVSLDTRHKVLQMAEKLGYLQKLRDDATAATATNLIGVIVADLTNSFSNQIVKAVHDTLENSGYSAIVGCNYEQSSIENRLLKQWASLNLKGLIIMPTAKFSKTINSVDAN